MQFMSVVSNVRSSVLPLRVRTSDHLDDAIKALDQSDVGALPVTSAASEDIVGWFDYDTALTRLRGARP